MLPATSRCLTGAIALGLTLALALASTACGSGDTRDGNDQRTITACELVDDDMVSRALGAGVSPPDATSSEGADALAGRSGCAWATRDGKAAVLVELLRTDDMSGVVRRTGFSAGARFDAARSRYPDAERIALGGANAIWVEEAAMLHVLAGTSYLTFEVAVPNPPAARRIAIALATAAIHELADRAD